MKKERHNPKSTRNSIHILTRMLFAWLLLLTLPGCLMEPDHTNPVDPENPAYNNVGTLVVTVTDLDDNPLPGAQVRMLEFDTAKYTLIDGTVEFELSPGKVYFEVDRDMYASQTIEATVVAFRTVSQVVELNGDPFIDSVQVRSRMVQTNESDYLFGYEFVVYAGDVDGRNDLTELLMYKPGETEYTIINADAVMMISEDVSFELSDYYELFGRDFRFVLYDESEDTACVVEQIYNILYYSGLSLDMLDISSVYNIGDMEFKWRNWASDLLPHPPDTYRLEIFANLNTNNSFIDTFVTFTNPVEIDTMSINIYQTDGFQDGIPRYWRLTMYDLFGNYVSSLRKSFTPVQIIGDEAQ